MLPSLSIGTRVACDGPPLGLPLKPPRVPPTPDGRPLFLRGVPDSEPLPVPGSGVSQSGRGRVGGRPLPRLRGMVSTTGGLLRPPASCSSSASCSPSSSSAPSCSTWSPSSSSSFCTTGSVISSSDTSTLTAGVEFPGQPSAWIRARMTTSCTYLLTSAVLGLRLCPFLVALLRSVRCCLVAIRTKLRYVLIASHLRASVARWREQRRVRAPSASRDIPLRRAYLIASPSTGLRLRDQGRTPNELLLFQQTLTCLHAYDGGVSNLMVLEANDQKSIQNSVQCSITASSSCREIAYLMTDYGPFMRLVTAPKLLDASLKVCKRPACEDTNPLHY